MAVGTPRATSRASVGPDIATTRARGAFVSRMPDIVRPVPDSMPLVTLTTDAREISQVSAVSRNPLDTLATTTSSRPRPLYAASASARTVARKFNARQVTLVAPGACDGFDCFREKIPKHDLMFAGRQHAGQRGSPRARAKHGDFHDVFRLTAGYFSAHAMFRAGSQSLDVASCACRSPAAHRRRDDSQAPGCRCVSHTAVGSATRRRDGRERHVTAQRQNHDPRFNAMPGRQRRQREVARRRSWRCLCRL